MSTERPHTFNPKPTLCTYSYLRLRGLTWSGSTLARMEKKALFPARIHPSGGRRIAWLVEEVDAYFDALAARGGEA